MVEIKLPEVSFPEGSIEFFQRILGPVAEAGDFLSDKIRFYRWKSSLATMKKAEEISKKYGIEPKEIPLKKLIPILEKSSLEEEDSPLIEKWATLLAQGASDPDSISAAYADILSRLSSDDVKLLESIVKVELCKEIINDSDGGNINATSAVHLLAMYDATFEFIREQFKKICKEFDVRLDEGRKILRGFSLFLVNNDQFSDVEYVNTSFGDGGKSDIFEMNGVYRKDASIDVLISSGLVIRNLNRVDMEAAEISISIISPTPLGVNFVIACRGDNIAPGREAIEPGKTK